ncbi:hypothetical protein HAX54_045591 [Datura stramonium]|uniref:Uncharacterized protein n=1 Tax=Datura stramonium TaxID=4076 RepID=A0ABS8WHU2_DATST|nr:hypothetical protein [Datura stramonium]
MIAKIRKKYDHKLQEAEAAFLLKKKELDVNQNKVLMNKLLADAFRCKCMNLKPSGLPGMRQVVPSSYLQHLHQVSQQPNLRSSPVTGLSSASQHSSVPACLRAPPVTAYSKMHAPVAGLSLAGQLPTQQTAAVVVQQHACDAFAVGFPQLAIDHSSSRKLPQHDIGGLPAAHEIRLSAQELLLVWRMEASCKQAEHDATFADVGSNFDSLDHYLNFKHWIVYRELLPLQLELLM